MSIRIPTRRRAGESRGLTRLQARARERSQRARSHLDRVRRQAPVRPRSIHRTASILAALSFAAGAVGGVPLLETVWQRMAPAPDRPRLFVGGAERVALPDVAAAIGADDAASLAALSPREIADRIAANPWIAEARAVRLPSGSLVARVTERVPAAVATAGDPAVPFAVDASGTPFAPAGEDEIRTLPALATRTPSAVGERNGKLARALALVATAARAGFDTTEVAIEVEPDAAFGVRFAGLAPRVLFDDGDPGVAIEKLARLLAADVPEARSAGIIDLRFADQAVLRDVPPSQGVATAAATSGRSAPSNSGQAG